MNFKDIDWARIEKDSKNVFEYYRTRPFKSIKDFKNDELKVYAEKHRIEYNEVLNLLQRGETQGEENVRNELKERSIISAEAGKYYLFQITTIDNIELEYYYNDTYKSFFQKGCITKHDPEIIISIGKIIGEYIFAWQQVLKNHEFFEPLFIPKVKEIENEPFNHAPYPCHNVKVIGLPDTMQKAKDFGRTLIKLNRTLVAKKSELLKSDFRSLFRLFNYSLIPEIRNQIYDFLQETVNNTDNGVYEKYSWSYQHLEEDLDNCLTILEEFKNEGIFEIDMSSFPEYRYHRENWFKILQEEFALVKTAFSFITQTNKEDSFKKLVKTIAQSIIEIIQHPEDYAIYKKHFEGKENKERENRRTSHIHHKLNDKLKPYFSSHVQHPIGQSKERKSSGTVDFAIFFANTFLTIGEAVNTIGSNDNDIIKNIKEHLDKLTDNYNTSKIDTLLSFVYYEENGSGKSNFFGSFKNYYNHLKEYAPSGYSCIDVKEVTSEYETKHSSIKILKSTHSYSNNDEDLFNVYHFYIDFSENKIQI